MSISSRTALAWSFAALLAAMTPAGFNPAAATIVFQTGNQQYFNVNIAADANQPSITGDIGNTGIQMTFESRVGPDGATLVPMHAQHGAAFVESAADSLPTAIHTGFSSLKLTPQAGYGFTAGDFKLDQLNGLTAPVGFVTFIGLDQFGQTTSTTLPLGENGQNPYNFFTLDNELVRQITITVPTTDLLQDLKQLSFDVAQVPEPSTVMLLASSLGLLWIGFRARQS